MNNIIRIPGIPEIYQDAALESQKELSLVLGIPSKYLEEGERCNSASELQINGFLVSDFLYSDKRTHPGRVYE